MCRVVVCQRSGTFGNTYISYVERFEYIVKYIVNCGFGCVTKKKRKKNCGFGCWSLYIGGPADTNVMSRSKKFVNVSLLQNHIIMSRLVYLAIKFIPLNATLSLEHV